MGVVSTIMGMIGFGMGFSAGLVAGYFLLIYVLPNDVKVKPQLSTPFCFRINICCD